MPCVYPPDQYPLLAQLALGVVLGAHFEEEVHKLLQRLGLAGHDKSDNVHEQASLGVAIEHNREDLLLQSCQMSTGSKAGQLQLRERTMVSIFCSSLPFSRAFFRSFCAGTSAALSWCTCSSPSASRSSRPCQVFVPGCTSSRGKSP